ncbi:MULTISPECIES: ABC transporter ATP-binding protein [unclassified Gordonia (in: high G+C Gram-positive bacteria)]|uniref:ABC transporter ATP-binding protein n=1 Tax=unclassified Gordonia (in: high G+C Gram-positive bacteria) TaxID=2657482 RepID=UPI001F0EA055|nr:ABC transporter ATP-binding protein [Gordonia sp. ABSL49_1]MCH5643272.1 ABC transporter ATP-binding protein [Gordonia sp. ABSL49_1]
MSSNAVIRATSVTKRFGDFTAVDDVTMDVKPGEVVGLLGANGAGKTTLIRILLGLLRPTEGTTSLFDGPPDRDRRARLGYVPQNLGLYRDLTVAENLDFSTGTYGVTTPALPDDLRSHADTLVGELPLGAQRRIAFLVALAHSPAALVLDEPTSGVDALSRARLWDTIRGESDKGTGVLVTTHYMEEAQECDRLLLMSSGKLVAHGSEADIIGDTRAVSVSTDDWQQAFAVLNAASVPVILSGRAIRVADTDTAKLDAILDQAGIPATITPVPATIEEKMLVLARHD